MPIEALGRHYPNVAVGYQMFSKIKFWLICSNMHCRNLGAALELPADFLASHSGTGAPQVLRGYTGRSMAGVKVLVLACGSVVIVFSLRPCGE